MCDLNNRFKNALSSSCSPGTGRHGEEMEALMCHTISGRAVGSPDSQGPLDRGRQLSPRLSKWTLPIWLLTLLASGTSHCPPRQPADGSEARPGAGKETDWWSDNISISEFMFIHGRRIKSSDEAHLRHWLILSSGVLSSAELWHLGCCLQKMQEDAREGDRCNNIFRFKKVRLNFKDSQRFSV